MLAFRLMEKRDTLIDPNEFSGLIHGEMASYGPFRFTVEEMRWGYLRLRLHFCDGLLRPGGTVSGPSLFTLADAALYGVVLSVTGKATMAVTTDLTMHFLHRPGRADVIAEARLLKNEGRLVFGTVIMHSEGSSRIVAHATGSYAVPRGLLGRREKSSSAL